MSKNSEPDRLDTLLGSIFHRHSCPETEALGEYHMNLLAPGQRLVVAQHLRLCPHCSAELALYAHDTESQQSWLAQLKDSISQVRWAIETPHALPAQRGSGYQQLYEIDNTKIRLLVEPATHGYQRWKLTGNLNPVENVERVILWPAQMEDEQATKSCVIDESNRYFTFDGLAAGSYYLSFNSPQTETWLGAMDVGPH